MKPHGSGNIRKKAYVSCFFIVFLALAIEAVAVNYFIVKRIQNDVNEGIEKGWIAFSEKEAETFLHERLREIGIFIALTAVAVLVVSFGAIFQFGRIVFQPLRDFADSLIENVENGRPFGPDAGTEDEIGQISDCFDRLMNEMDEMSKQFEIHERTLCHLENVFENSANAIVLTDLDGNITKCNTKASETFGYDFGEFGKISARALSPNEKEIEQLLTLLRKDGFVKRYEIRMKKKDGTIFPAEVSVSLLRENGTVVGAAASIRNISNIAKAISELGTTFGKLTLEINERRRVETELAKAKEYLENVFENSADVIIVVDKYSRILKWNKMAAEFFGYSFEELKGKSTFELYSDKEELEAVLSKLRKDGSVRRREISMKKKDGSVNPIEASISILKDEKGKNIGSVAVIRDLSDIKKANEKLRLEITERLRVEKELEKSRNHLENVIENSADAISIVDKHGKIVNWNLAAARIYGYSFDEAVKMNFTDLYATGDEYEQMISILCEEGYVSRYEIGMRTGEGLEIPVEVSIAMLMDEEGGTAGSVCVARDLSDIKKALWETEMAMREAEEANKKIMKSLHYAGTMQRSLLPNPGETDRFLPDSFFLWIPREVVGGDFFHAEEFDDGIFVAVFDCTGHGVPGAFMTMIASSGLRQVIGTECCHDPAEILKRLNYIIKKTLQQDTTHVLSDDGLDAAVCFVKRGESGRRVLTFAGAQMPLYLVRDGDVSVVKGDKRSIGYKRSNVDHLFTNHTMEIDGKTSYYMATDGYIHQIGGPRERCLGSRKFREILKDCGEKPFEKQPGFLSRMHNDFRGRNDRLDDITIVGFGFPERPAPPKRVRSHDMIGNGF